MFLILKCDKEMIFMQKSVTS